MSLLQQNDALTPETFHKEMILRYEAIQSDCTELWSAEIKIPQKQTYLHPHSQVLNHAPCKQSKEKTTKLGVRS